MRPWKPLVLVAALAATAHAAPTIESLYIQGRVPNGAASIPGYLAPVSNPFPQPSVAGDVVRFLGVQEITSLPNGDFVGVVNTNPEVFGFGNTPSATSQDGGAEYLFGSNDRGVTPQALQREGTINNASTGNADASQRGFGSVGIDYAGDITYSANIPDPRPNRSQFSIGTLWENETLIYQEGDAVPAGPLAGLFFDGASQVYRSPAGETRWLASITDTSFGNFVSTALLRDTTTFDVLLQSGDTIPGLGTVDPTSSFAITNISWSLGGTHYIAKVDVEPGFTSTEDALTVSGAAVFTKSGGLVREGQVIPAADGGLPGETWTGFQRLDVNEAGVAVFGAFTSGPDGQDDVIVVDGEVRYREGDIVDGVTLGGVTPRGVGINDRGDVAFVWSDTVFINDQAVATVGSPVDTDGDDIADAAIASALFGDEFEITNLPAAGGDGLPVVYFSADVAGEGDAHFRLAPADTSTGDYNGDGVVNAADYTVWRDTDGSTLLLGADGDEDNTVDSGDYTVWTAGYGSTVTPATAVPEPQAACLALLAAWGVLGTKPRRR